MDSLKRESATKKDKDPKDKDPKDKNSKDKVPKDEEPKEESSSKTLPKVDMFLYNYLLKKRGLSHASLHRSNSEFFRTPTEDCDVILDRNLAESRRPVSIEDELILLMYDNVLSTIVDTWEGKASVKFFKKPDPVLNYCEMSAISASQASSQESLKNVSKTSSNLSSKKSGSKKRDSKTKIEVRRLSKTKKQTSSEILKTEKELQSQTLVKSNTNEGSSIAIVGNVAEPPIITSGVYASPIASHISSLEAMPDWKPIFLDEDASITFKNRALYIGRISRKGMKGKGLYRWSNGTIYEGNFVNNMPHGFGTYTWPDMSFFEGQIYQGLRHGSGFFLGPPVEPDEDRIYMSGNWHLGKLVGKGIIKQGYQSYEGLLDNGTRNGSGTRRYDEYNVYSGEFVDGVRHGRGTMVWDNNDIYMGEWEDGIKSGYGQYIWDACLYPDICFFNQNLFYGTWENDLKQGMGTLILKSGCLYDGNWEKDMKHGVGLVVCKNGLMIKSDRLYYKNHPAAAKDEIIKMPEKAIVEKKKKRKKNSGKSESTKSLSPNSTSPKYPSPRSQTSKTASSATSKEDTMPEVVQIPAINNRKPQANLSRRLRKTKGLEKAMIKAIENQLNYNRSLYSNNNLKPRSIPFHLPDHYIILEYHLNRLMANIPNLVKYKKTKLINLEYNPTVSFHTAPFEEAGSSIIYNLDITDCKKTSPEISAKMAKSPFKTLTSGCLDQLCASNIRESEECHLRNMITLHLQFLRKVYDKYASASLKKDFPMNCKPVMVRLFLWQFLRDCGVHKKGIILVQLDRDVSINVSCGLLYDHNPFERLQFFQFLHYLLEVSWCLYGKYMDVYSMKWGVLATAFDRFLLDDVTPGIEKQTGHALTTFKNTLPIHAVYGMYKEMGEPLTVHHLVSTIINQCSRSEESFNNRRITISNSKQAQAGYYSALEEIIVFCPALTESVFEESSINFMQNPPEEFDLIGLRILKDLNIKDILICCGEICPELFCNDMLVKIDCEIAFLEFYEILILCIDRIFYNINYEKWKILEDNRLAELDKLTKSTEKVKSDKKKKKGK